KPPPGKTLGPADDPEASAAASGPGFVLLTHAQQIPTGSQIDARAGSLRLNAAATTTYGPRQTGTFNGAIFSVAQASQGINKGLTTLSIVEAAFPGAPSYTSCTAGAARYFSPGASAASSKVLQALHAS